MLRELKLTVETSCVESSAFQLDYMLELPGGLLKNTRVVVFSLEISDSAGLGWGLGKSLSCFFTFSGDCNGESGLRTVSLEQHYSKCGSLAISNRITLEFVRNAVGSGAQGSVCFQLSRRFLLMILKC